MHPLTSSLSFYKKEAQRPQGPEASGGLGRDSWGLGLFDAIISLALSPEPGTNASDLLGLSGDGEAASGLIFWGSRTLGLSQISTNSKDDPSGTSSVSNNHISLSLS